MKCLWIAVTVLVLVGCGGSSGGPPSNPGPGSDGGVGNPGDGGVAGLGFSPEPLVLGTTPGTPASACKANLAVDSCRWEPPCRAAAAS